MQNLTTSTATNGRSAKAPVLNPIQAFESTAKKIWDSPRSIEERSAQLAGLGKAINGYVEKIDDMLVREKLDVWVRLSINRSKVYLELLASDVNMLASTDWEQPGDTT